MADDDFLIKLKALCIEFDNARGDWPEDEYQGMALWSFATNASNAEQDEYFKSLKAE